MLCAIMKGLYPPILVLFLCIPGYSQVKVTKGRKIVTIEATRILQIETKFDIISAPGSGRPNDKGNEAKAKYNVDVIRDIDARHDSIVILARRTTHYKDSVTGKIYSNKEMENEYDKGNMFFSVYRVTNDTTFHFEKSDVIRVRIRIKDNAKGGGFGTVGLALMGTALTITGTISAVDGEAGGFALIGAGVLALGTAKYLVEKSRWFKDLYIGSDQWMIDTR